MAELAPQLEAHMDRLLDWRTYDAFAVVVKGIGTLEVAQAVTAGLWDHPAIEGGKDG